jgi:hypothetical protein
MVISAPDEVIIPQDGGFVKRQEERLGVAILGGLCYTGMAAGLRREAFCDKGATLSP